MHLRHFTLYASKKPLKPSRARGDFNGFYFISPAEIFQS